MGDNEITRVVWAELRDRLINRPVVRFENGSSITSLSEHEVGMVEVSDVTIDVFPAFGIRNQIHDAKPVQDIADRNRPLVAVASFADDFAQSTLAKEYYMESRGESSEFQPDLWLEVIQGGA